MRVGDRQFRVLHSPHFVQRDSNLSPRRDGTEFCFGICSEAGAHARTERLIAVADRITQNRREDPSIPVAGTGR